MTIGPFEILLVLFVIALIIGPRRVTNMFRALGRGVQDFASELGGEKSSGSRRSAIGEGEDDDEEDREPPKESDRD